MTSRFILTFVWLVATLFGLSSSLLLADEIKSEVTYVAWKTLYLNAGRAHGIENGLSGSLYRDSSLIGEINIAATAESSCVATLSGDSVIAVVGDFVVIHLPNRNEEHGDLQTSASTNLKGPIDQRSTPFKRKPTAQLRGRFSVQMDAYDDRKDSGTTELLPGLSTRMTLQRVAGEGSEFNLKYRGRKLGNSADYEWQHRLYTAALSLTPERNHWQASLGRIQAGSVAGIGYIDGGYGEVALGNALYVGMFGGAEAELDMSRTDLSTSKAGALVAYRDKSGLLAKTQATLAISGEYKEGHISREFIYQQFTYSSGGRFTLYESADLNINRGWKQDIEGAIIKPANFLLNIRYSPARAVTFSAGYDGRSRYHTWETRETPDSLFDDAIRHGMRAGAEIMMMRSMRLSVQQSYRSEPSTERLYPSGMYALSSNSLWNGRIGAMLRYSRFENLYTVGEQQALSVSLTPVRGLDLRSEIGQTDYNFQQRDVTSSSNWLRVTADVNLKTGSYCSVQAERNVSSGSDGIRAFVELGQRIR